MIRPSRMTWASCCHTAGSGPFLRPAGRRRTSSRTARWRTGSSSSPPSQTGRARRRGAGGAAAGGAGEAGRTEEEEATTPEGQTTGGASPDHRMRLEGVRQHRRIGGQGQAGEAEGRGEAVGVAARAVEVVDGCGITRSSRAGEGHMRREGRGRSPWRWWSRSCCLPRTWAKRRQGREGQGEGGGGAIIGAGGGGGGEARGARAEGVVGRVQAEEGRTESARTDIR